MPPSVRKPQPSTPNSNIALVDSIGLEDVNFNIHGINWITIEDSIHIEDVGLSVGSAEWIEIEDEISSEFELFHFYLHNIFLDTSIDIEVSQNFAEQLKTLSEATTSDGDMKKLIYDPIGIEADVFNAGNLYGNLDGGTFN